MGPRIILVRRIAYDQCVLCRPEIEDGVCRVDLEPLLDALKYEIDSQGLDDGFILIRPRKRRRPKASG